MKCLILSGTPGAGKTTLGKLVADKWGWTFIEKDQLHPLPDKFLSRGTENEEYRRLVRPRAYRMLAEEVSGALQESHVVVEAPLLHEMRSGDRETTWVKNFPPGTECLLVWVTCNREVQYLRRMQRSARQDRHLLDRDWQQYVRDTAELFRTPEGVLVLDSSEQSPEDLLRQIEFFNER